MVFVEVDAIIPDADPSEPCYGPDTVELLRTVESRAKAGDIDWLRRNGKVYEAVESA